MVHRCVHTRAWALQGPATPQLRHGMARGMWRRTEQAWWHACARSQDFGTQPYGCLAGPTTATTWPVSTCFECLACRLSLSDPEPDPTTRLLMPYIFPSLACLLPTPSALPFPASAHMHTLAWPCSIVSRSDIFKPLFKETYEAFMAREVVSRAWPLQGGGGVGR